MNNKISAFINEDGFNLDQKSCLETVDNKEFLKKTEQTFVKKLDKKSEQVFNVITTDIILFVDIIRLEGENESIMFLKEMIHKPTNRKFGKEWTDSIASVLKMNRY